MDRRIVWIVVIVGLVVRVAVAVAKPEVLWIDDSFYSLGIARNIALGRGWTHDGLNVTNGFQPLYVFLMVPLYWILPSLDLVVPVLSLVLESILNVATGWLLFRLVDSLVGPRGALVGLLAWCFSPYVISGVNGLETPILAFLVLLTTHLYTASWRSILIATETPWQRRAVLASRLGFLLGLLTLTRIDSLFFTVALCADLGLRLLKCLRHDRAGLGKALGVMGILGGTLLVTLLPWFAASVAHTDRLAFDSGTATRLKSIAEHKGGNIHLDHLLGLIPYLQLRVFTPFLPWSALVRTRYTLASILIMLTIFLLACRSDAIRRKVVGFIAPLSFIWLYGIGLTAAYVFYQFTIWNWPRYFYPLCVIGLISLGVWVEVVWDGLQRFPLAQKSSWVPIVCALIGLGPAALLPISLPKDINPLLTGPEEWFTKTQFDAAAWLRQNTASETRVGAFQSGIIGYYSGRQVVNLDGVVNSAVLPYYLRKDVGRYLVIQHIDYLVDWPLFIDHVDFERAGLEAKVVAVFTGVNDVEVVALSSTD